MKNFTRIHNFLSGYQGIFILKIDGNEFKFKSGRSPDGNVTFISFFDKPESGRGSYNYLGIINRTNEFFVTSASKYANRQDELFVKLFKTFWNIVRHTGSTPNAVECYIKN
jgi:hypothetical protein